MGKNEARRRAGKLRTVALAPGAVATGRQLMEQQDQVTQRYMNWARDTVAAMNLGDPKEGHQWVVDPKDGKVRERPVGRPSPSVARRP